MDPNGNFKKLKFMKVETSDEDIEIQLHFEMQTIGQLKGKFLLKTTSKKVV